MSRIRIVDIARMANVSPGTVDRVIHHRGGVSDETRILIEKIIEENDSRQNIESELIREQALELIYNGANLKKSKAISLEEFIKG